MSDTINITNAEIAETIVRTAYSRLNDCLTILTDQSQGLKEVQLTDLTKNRMSNMLFQDFSCAHNPRDGSSPLRHAKTEDKERDLAVTSHFNELDSKVQKALTKSAMTALVGNFNASPAAQGIRFKL